MRRSSSFESMTFFIPCCAQDREFVEMGPDALMIGGGGASLVPGSGAVTGLGRFTSSTNHFLNKGRQWWCCRPARRKRNSIKINTVSFPLHGID